MRVAGRAVGRLLFYAGCGLVVLGSWLGGDPDDRRKGYP